MENQPLNLTVSEFLTLTNQVLDNAFPSVVVEGEVASFKVNQGKYVFFDLKDSESSVGCFMMLFSLRQPIEDGMRVRIVAQPKLTKWGKFSLTVQSIKPVGEGDLKRSMQLLQAKLEKEGLFALERKRPLPHMPQQIAVISSKDAAGYKDFIKIIDERWGGLQISLAHVQVQGDTAPDQIIRALDYFNSRQQLPEVIVILRGGGSADDLNAFNDEKLVRAVAASRVPVLTGIGHEVDTCLVDLVADKRASTPSNAAQVLVPDREEVIRHNLQLLKRAATSLGSEIQQNSNLVEASVTRIFEVFSQKLNETESQLASLNSLLRVLDPERVLERGYAIVSGDTTKGGQIKVRRQKDIIIAEVIDVKTR